MPDYYKLIQEQKGNPVGMQQPNIRTNQSELDKRMQVDADLLHLTDYVMKDKDQRAIPDIIYITLNRPAVFAANVLASLGSARQQVVVETENKAIDTKLVEDFISSGLAMADRRLRDQGKPLLNPFADTQFCIRGGCARLVLLRRIGEAVISDIRNWDRRYTYYEQGEEGLAWAGYETMRSKDDIISDYGEEAASKVVGREGSVLDVWDDKVNEVWVAGNKVKEEPNPYSFCPVVLRNVSLGYGAMLLDRDWQKYEGESIFFMIRHIVPELNRLASILATLTMQEVKAALQYQNPQGTPQDEPPDRPEMGDVVSTGPGRLDPIRLGEAKQAAQMLYSMMEKAFQEGSYTDIDIGNVQQPFSAVALVTIGENKDMVYMPRLVAKELLNTATAEMLIRQARMISGSIELGVPGHKRSFPVSKLEGEYSVDFKYFVKSPKIDIARMSLAKSAAQWYPRKYIYSQVLQVEDPDGLTRDWYSEQAELISPIVLKYRIINSLLDKAEKNNDDDAAMEAKIMAMELGVTIDQVRNGVLPEPQEPQASAGETLPLLGEGGKVGGLAPGGIPNLQGGA